MLVGTKNLTRVATATEFVALFSPRVFSPHLIHTYPTLFPLPFPMAPTCARHRKDFLLGLIPWGHTPALITFMYTRAGAAVWVGLGEPGTYLLGFHVRECPRMRSHTPPQRALV